MAPLPQPLTVKKVKLGSQGFEVSKQGLGCMGMSAFYGPPKPERDMIELIRHAASRGITFLDTSDVYGPHTNEILVGKAIKGFREKVQLATKFGIYFNAEGGGSSVRGDPEYVRSACEGSLKRLDVECIDLYYQHRLDATVPIEVTVGAMKKLVKEGKVKYIGLSEAPSSEIQRAHAVHPITAVQLEWSLWSRDVEEDIVGTCRELGIGIVSYSPLARGFFAGLNLAELGPGDFRKFAIPRVLPENLVSNQKFYDRLVEIGEKHGKSPGQVALAWVQNQGEDVVPIPGTTKAKNLEENIGALGIRFSSEELQEMERAVPIEDVVGDQYAAKADMDLTWRFASTPPLSSWLQKA